jgi:hypothetical protein
MGEKMKVSASAVQDVAFKALDSFRIEIPSWGFANTGTRFGKFVQAAAATTIEEKFADAGEVSQSRTNCLSYDGWLRPGCHVAAGQKRDESGVQTSSIRINSPLSSIPNSSFVSAMIIPLLSA